ncbi:hypothetical protein CK203_047349 [Vitis vinifera]|uniref:Uncharacterized protein n=1 Tax=Vitis vinifera TaxID=29760 RepID=A0A438HHQ1_VITVI|nr:hypothetical protein CK203_047349 [Vitis vinifera]
MLFFLFKNIALMLAVLISKIARIDYPKNEGDSIVVISWVTKKKEAHGGWMGGFITYSILLQSWSALFNTFSFDLNDSSRPELFSVLAQQLQSADILTSHRIFMILFRTLKELSTKRLTSDQRNFAEV